MRLSHSERRPGADIGRNHQRFGAPFAALLADVPTTHDSTLYMLLGDWFAWLALAVLAFALVQGVRPQINEARRAAQ
jgi:apolipoprotein N-acyltransferase